MNLKTIYFASFSYLRDITAVKSGAGTPQVPCTAGRSGAGTLQVHCTAVREWCRYPAGALYSCQEWCRYPAGALYSCQGVVQVPRRCLVQLSGSGAGTPQVPCPVQCQVWCSHCPADSMIQHSPGYVIRRRVACTRVPHREGS